MKDIQCSPMFIKQAVVMGFFSLGDALEFRVLCVLTAAWKTFKVNDSGMRTAGRG